jgi:Arc/MetJ-type ribon-helix-helix transcriptional regulator
MVNGMATKKVTVTLDEQQVEAIRSLVESGRAGSVSGFVQDAVSVTLDDMVGWGAALALALEATGGEMSASEREWADRVLGVAGPSDRTVV